MTFLQILKCNVGELGSFVFWMHEELGASIWNDILAFLFFTVAMRLTVSLSLGCIDSYFLQLLPIEMLGYESFY